MNTSAERSATDTNTRAAARITQSVRQVEEWVRVHDYRGYEPFDGLSARVRPLTFGNLFLERLLQQIVRQSPVNLRPLLGIRAQSSTKGRGYMAWGHLALYRLTGDELHAETARACLAWLLANPAPGYSDPSWGNHFDFSSRVGKLAAGEPIIVWTGLIGLALMEAYRTLGEQKWLVAARRVCDWILGVPREQTERGTCLSYVAFEQRSIHNSNMIGAALLAEVGHETGEQKLLDVASAAAEYTGLRQLENGGWYYGESENYHWIDSFHTGYVLDSFKRYAVATGDNRFDEQLTRGIEFFARSFVRFDGSVQYYHDRLYPIDVQAVAQTIETLTFFSDGNSRYLELALRAAHCAIDTLQDRTGYFYYRKYPVVTARTPMLHWGQATMFKAMADLMARLTNAESPAGDASEADSERSLKESRNG